MALIDYKSKPETKYDVPDNMYAVTPHDTNALTDGTNTIIAKCLHIGGNAGAVTVIMRGGQTVALYGTQGGYLWGAFTHVKSTGTAATGIVMGW